MLQEQRRAVLISLYQLLLNNCIIGSHKSYTFDHTVMNYEAIFSDLYMQVKRQNLQIKSVKLLTMINLIH